MFIVTFVRVGDHFGRRLVFLGGLVIYTISSIIMVFVDSYVPLLVLRLCHGLGASMMFSVAFASSRVEGGAGRRFRLGGLGTLRGRTRGLPHRIVVATFDARAGAYNLRHQRAHRVRLVGVPRAEPGD
jgi:MFS family permease